MPITVEAAAEGILLPLAIVLNDTAYVFQWSAQTSVSVASEAVYASSVPCSPLTATAVAAPVVATVDLSGLGFVPPFSVH